MKEMSESKVKTKIRRLIVCMLCLCMAAGCGLSSDEDNRSSRSVPEETTEETSEETTEEATESTTAKITEATTEKTTEKKTEMTTEASTEKSADLSTIPDYSGEAYIEINGNKPFFTDEEKKSTEAFELYSDLDRLGRCGPAYANICHELMPTEARGEIGDIRPSGWHTVKYSEVIEDNYLYNRSHLIAYSLAGENANPKNLITGTRYLNQETMQIFELKVLDYVKASENHVLYRVTPYFEGDNLLAKGVEMEAWSVEDEGRGICFHVFCYNVQPHIVIDYATGDSRLADDVQTTEQTTEAATEVTVDSSTTETAPSTSDTDFANTSREFVVNTNTRKIHMPSCSSVSDMKDKNKWECTSTLNELIEKGYSPCGRCLAEYR